MKITLFIVTIAAFIVSLLTILAKQIKDKTRMEDKISELEKSDKSCCPNHNDIFKRNGERLDEIEKRLYDISSDIKDKINTILGTQNVILEKISNIKETVEKHDKAIDNLWESLDDLKVK